MAMQTKALQLSLGMARQASSLVRGMAIQAQGESPRPPPRFPDSPASSFPAPLHALPPLLPPRLHAA